MKKVNVKDVDVVDAIEENKKMDIKKIILIVFLVIVSLVGVFFWSTKIRWDAELTEKKHEVLYYGQEEVKVEELTGFFGDKLEVDLKENDALLMYCNSEYGDKCVTGDFNNGFENLLRNPSVAINIVIIVDLILLYLLLKDKINNKVKAYVITGLLIVVGMINLAIVVYDIATYYSLVSNSEYVVEAEIIKGLVTENDKEYYPVVRYSTEQDEYVKEILVPLDGKVTDDLSSKNKLTLYYDKVDNEVVTIKQSLLKYIVPSIVGVMYIVLGIINLILFRKTLKKEEGI